MRDSIIKEIIKYKKIYKDIMVLDADCSTSTKSRLFQYSFSNDFINVGIAEQNMIGIASGLSLRGKIPIVNGFSKMLIMRSFEQLHDLIELQNVKIVIIGHYAGLSAGLEGATHHSVNDISLMRNINNLNILTPGNSFDLTQCIDFALKSEIASYIRLSKNDIVNPCSNKIIQKNGFNQEDYIFDDSKKKVIIISVGFSYVQTAKTNEWLNMRKINHSFISVWDFQLINYEELSCLIKKKDIVIIIDEHKEFGSIGKTIMINIQMEFKNKVKLLCIKDDVVTDTGDYEYLIDSNKINTNAIKELINKENW